MSQNILITGGAGFIGSKLATAAAKIGHNVTIIDVMSPQIHGQDHSKSPLFQSIDKSVRCVVGDIRNRVAMESLLREAEVVVHLAAETGTGQSMYQISQYSEVNIQGTAVLLDLLTNTKNRVSKVVVASSRAIYGEGRYECDVHGEFFPEERKAEELSARKYQPLCPICKKTGTDRHTTENSKIHPTSVYGMTKHAQESMSIIVGKAIGVPTIGLRFQNVYGPGQSLSNPYTGILSIFSTRAMAHKPIDVFEDGLESRDFVYVDDVVRSLLLAMSDKVKGFHAINVGTGQKTTVLDVAKRLCETYGSRSNVAVTHKFRVGDIRTNYADLAKAKDVLGFVPEYGFEAGIKLFAEWVLGQELALDRYEEAMQELATRGLLK